MTTLDRRNGLTAVVVNDDMIQRNILSGLLLREGIEVQSFERADSALMAMNRKRPPDLIITDLYMPGIDGWRFCRLLRSAEYPAFNKIPILAVSATFAGEEASRITFELGADAFLPSPIDGQRFLAVVRNLLSGDRPGGPLRVLIVEDLPSKAKWLRESFEKEGYQVTTSLAVQEALAEFNRSAYNIAVISYDLPDGKGDRLLTDFKTVQPDCVCIMMTTDPNPELAVAWMRQGAAAYLQKPFEPAYLHELCARARRERALLRVEDLLELRTRELKESREQLAETNQLLAAVLEYTHILTAFLDPQFNFIWVNRAYAASVQKQPGFFQGKNYFDLYPNEANYEIFRKVADTGAPHFSLSTPMENDIQPDRETGFWDWSLIPVKDEATVVTGLVLTLSEVTERVLAETALRESEAKFRNFFESVVDMVVVTGPEQRFLFTNKAVEKKLGYSSDELSSMNLPDVWPADEWEAAKSCFDAILRGEGECCTIPLLRKDGERVPVETRLWPGKWDGADCIFVISKDQTTVQEAQQRFESFFRNNPALMALSTIPERQFVDVNDAFLKNLGYSRIEIIGKTAAELDLFLDPKMQEAVANQLKLEEHLVSHELRVRCKDGSVRDGLFSGEVLHNLGQAFFLTVMIDITDRKQAEKDREKLQTQLNQAQKLESVGRLAGGVAHDLNNLLVPILGYSEMLLEEFSTDDLRKQSVDEILRAGLRARDLVRQLLAFSRRQTLEYKSVNLNDIINRFGKLLQRTIRQDITLKIHLASNLPFIRADVGQIEQVIMNLTVNAQDAMPGGGELIFETASIQFDKTLSSRFKGTHPGPYVMLAIRDTGCGIKEEIRKHIFEPFYSTKGETGTGLGLATVYGIIKQHGGAIGVSSELNAGSTFKVYLPIYGENLDEDQSEKIAIPILQGSETVLLVEDNPQVRQLTYSILKRQGYKVLVAGSGAEALLLLEKPVHLLLTDVVMPDMSGKELFAKVVEKYPGTRVLYMSGYAADVIAHRGFLDKGIQFIQKPFTMQVLATKLREVLNPA